MTRDAAETRDNDPGPRMEVAAGILRDDAGRVLIAERRDDAAFPGLWEFPGGKLDADESAQHALYRELREELGVVVRRAEHFLSIDRDYSDRRVRLHFYLVSAWRGEIQTTSGQNLRWVPIEALDPRELLPADAPVVEALRRL